MSKKGLGKFALGAAIGAGLGVLFAPKKGSDTRKILKTKLDELLEKVKDIDIKEVRDDMEIKINEIKKELEELDKEKVLKIAKEKGKALQEKAEDLYKYAVKKGTPAFEKVAAEIKEKTLCVAKDVVLKLENEKQANKTTKVAKTNKDNN